MSENDSLNAAAAAGNRAFDALEERIADGMHRWEAGTLSTATLVRLSTDALAELWVDCYRRDDRNQVIQRDLFARRVANMLYCATGADWKVTT